MRIVKALAPVVALVSLLTQVSCGQHYFCFYAMDSTISVSMPWTALFLFLCHGQHYFCFYASSLGSIMDLQQQTADLF